MAQNIKGITVELGANTTKLQNALKELNKPINKASSELRKINESLKFNPGNTDMLRQKQKLLGEQFTANADKLNALRQAMAKANAAGVDKDTAEYRELEREILKVTNQVKKLAKEQAIASLEASKLGQINNTFTNARPKIDAVASGFNKITKAAAGLSAALIGMSITRAFAKLETLEEVSAVFDGLGYSAEKVNDIMDATTQAVSGTKYAMADMATVAKGAMGAGADSQYELANYLGRVSDLAAFAGGNVSDFGNLMNKALSKGTVDARLLNSMLYAGIPIYNDLADTLGVTQDELKKMISAGKVGFDELFKATEKYDGLAQKLGMSSLGGAATILKQTWGNVGVEFLKGAYEPMREGLTNLVTLLKSNMGTVKEWGAAFGEALKFLIAYAKDGTTSMSGLSTNAKKMAEVMKPVVSVVSNLVKAFANLPKNVKLTAVAVATLTGPALKMVSAFMGGYQALYKFIKFLTTAKASLTATTAATSALTVMQQAQTGATVAGTVATRALNTALLANPAVLLVAGVAALTAALVGLHIALKDTAGGYDQYRVASKQVREANEELQTTFRDLEKTREQTIQSGVGELNYYQQLKNELAEIVDENGRVKAGYEDRANYIIGKLNEELNANITYASGVTNYNKQVQDSIQGIIDAKKAEILLQAYEQEYLDVLKQQKEAQENLEKATKAVADAEEDLTRAQAEGASAEEIKGREANIVELRKDLDKATKSYQTIINKGKEFNKIQEAAAKGDTATVEAYVNGTLILEEELTNQTQAELEQRLKDQETYKAEALKLYEETGDEQYREMATSYDQNIALIKNKMTDMATAISSNSGKVSNAMAGVMNSAKSGAGSISFNTIGQNAIAGIISGIESRSVGLNAVTRVKIAAMKLIAEKELGINSPSKVFKQIGAYTMEGLALGISENANQVYASLENVADSMESGFSAMSTGGNMVSDISNAIGTGLAIAGSGDRTPINANIVVELGGNKVGETIVSLYDTTSNQLYQGA